MTNWELLTQYRSFGTHEAELVARLERCAEVDAQAAARIQALEARVKELESEADKWHEAGLEWQEEAEKREALCDQLAAALLLAAMTGPIMRGVNICCVCDGITHTSDCEVGQALAAYEAAKMPTSATQSKTSS